MSSLCSLGGGSEGEESASASRRDGAEGVVVTCPCDEAQVTESPRDGAEAVMAICPCDEVQASESERLTRHLVGRDARASANGGV